MEDRVREGKTFPKTKSTKDYFLFLLVCNEGLLKPVTAWKGKEKT